MPNVREKARIVAHFHWENFPPLFPSALTHASLRGIRDCRCELDDFSHPSLSEFIEVSSKTVGKVLSWWKIWFFFLPKIKNYSKVKEHLKSLKWVESNIASMWFSATQSEEKTFRFIQSHSPFLNGIFFSPFLCHCCYFFSNNKIFFSIHPHEFSFLSLLRKNLFTKKMFKARMEKLWRRFIENENKKRAEINFSSLMDGLKRLKGLRVSFKSVL